jgi:hypothetical protein
MIRCPKKRRFDGLGGFIPVVETIYGPLSASKLPSMARQLRNRRNGQISENSLMTRSKYARTALWREADVHRLPL